MKSTWWPTLPAALQEAHDFAMQRMESGRRRAVTCSRYCSNGNAIGRGARPTERRDGGGKRAFRAYGMGAITLTRWCTRRRSGTAQTHEILAAVAGK